MGSRGRGQHRSEIGRIGWSETGHFADYPQAAMVGNPSARHPEFGGSKLGWGIVHIVWT
jgi:hypothetical protein